VKVFANSVQKSGTHLLLQLLTLLGVPRYPRWRLDPEWTRERSVGKRLLMRPPGVGEPVPIGQGVELSSWWISRLFRRMPSPSSLLGHASWSPELAARLDALGVRTVCIVRDPRDVVVSYAHFVVKIGKDKITRRPEHRALMALPDHAARLRVMIEGNEGTASVPSRFRAFLPWRSQPGVHVLRFEDLVGGAGGGDDAVQRREVGRVAEFLGLALTDDDLAQVCRSLWGGTPTFRKGQIGEWREELTPALLELAHREMDDLLFELGYETTAKW
jgi:sulfotransferase family protein